MTTMRPSLSRATRVFTIAFGLAGFASVLTLSATAATAQTAATSAAPAGPTRFEPKVKEYEDADRKDAPPKHAILLAGDSQFYRWSTLHEDLPDYTIINRGIDSFQMSDLLYYADRLVLPYAPRMIVLHVGGNDVNNKRTPEQVLADFEAFVAKVRVSMPDVPIVFSSTTPGPARWDQAAARVATNDLVKAYVATQKNLMFIDLWHAMLTPDGQPREDIWVADRIHPNHEGYLIRVRLMRPLLGPPDRR